MLDILEMVLDQFGDVGYLWIIFFFLGGFLDISDLGLTCPQGEEISNEK